MDFTLTPEQLELRDRARKAAAPWRAQVDAWDAADEAPWPRIASAIADSGLLGLTMPQEYGGLGLTALDYVVVVEELFTVSQSWVVAEPVFGSTGPGPSIVLRAESEETRRKFLPDIVAGRKFCGIALTEPAAGSDLTSLTTTAVDAGDHWVLNGSKRFITGCPVNELYATFVRFDDIPGHRGIGVVVVEDDTPGLRLERGARFVGTRGVPHGEMHFENARVPKENLVRGAGHFADLMQAFNMERIHNSTLSLGLAEAAYAEAVEYVRHRRAFGKPIIEFQATYHSLVEMRMAIDAHRMLTYRAAAGAVEGRYPDVTESSMAKLSGCTMLPEVTLKAMILCGGDGTTYGDATTSGTATQRLHRDSMAALVAGGSPPVLKNAIAAQLFPEHRFRQ